MLSILDLPFKSGNRASAFNELQSIVISESLARKAFGNDDPIGKTIKMNAGQAYAVDGSFMVTGVFKDFPNNSSYRYEWLSPYVVFETKNDWLKPWNNNLTETLVELQPAADIEAINTKLVSFITAKTGVPSAECFLFAMNDWHLRDHFTDGKQDGGNIKYVRLFSLIAVIILIIACVNFTNLSTALSEKRSKEVGVRKVLGAERNGLVGRFIGEAMLMSFVAVIVATVLIFFTAPLYGNLIGNSIEENLFSWFHVSCIALMGLVTGLLAGTYPAFYLSSFAPIRALKNLKIKTSAGALFVRKGLVTGQFAVSITLIVCTAVIYQQIQHIRQRDLGFDKDHVIFMNLQGAMKKNFTAIRNELIQSGFVDNAAMSLHDPLHIYSSSDRFGWAGKDPNNKISIHSNVVSPEFVSVMHMKIIEGRDFYPNGRDNGAVVINQSMAKLMGASGKAGALMTIDTFKLKVAGIVEDVLYNDVYGAKQPLILLSYSGPETVMEIRFKRDADLEKALAATEAVMKANNPGYPFDFNFLDEQFNALFVMETLIGKLAAIFAVLAIFISCLGLFGLAAYSAENRRKEMGIRKVLGASAQGLAALLSKEFLKLVALSCVIAFPVSWYLMSEWLQNFGYRTNVHWWVFAIAGLSSLFIAVLTVSTQALKAALTNPVETLRTE